LDAAVDKWAQSASAAATAWAAALPAGNERSELLGSLIRTLGRTDPRAAADVLQTGDATVQVLIATQNLFSDWAVYDPEAAAAAVAQIKGKAGAMAVQGAAKTLALADPTAAAKWAESIVDPGERRAAISATTREWSNRDPAAAINWVKNLEPSVRRIPLAQCLSKLAGQDLGAALAQIEALPPGPERTRTVTTIVWSIPSADPQQTLAMLSQLDSSRERDAAEMMMCDKWASTDRPAALDWYFKNGSADKWLGNAINEWARTAPDEAMQWARTLPKSDRRDSAMGRLASSLAESDPARAQQLFGELSTEAQARITGAFASALAAKDVNAACKWAEALPPGNAQSDALEWLAVDMAGKDPKAAAQWLQGLPTGGGRDRAISSYCTFALSDDPATALKWAQLISDETDRGRAIEDLANTWLKNDAASARKWLESAALPPAEKERILRP
jgi:hypothetical protein